VALDLVCMLVSSLGSFSESLVKLSSLFMTIVLDHDTDDIDVIQ
jgi:hypothetical protein